MIRLSTRFKWPRTLLHSPAGMMILLLAACRSSFPEAVVPVTRGCQAFVGISAQRHGENAERSNELNAPALDSSKHAFHHPDQQKHDWIVNGKLGMGRHMAHHEINVAFVTWLEKKRSSDAVKMGASQNLDI